MSKKKILIVEDEADQRTWLTAFFEDNGYETFTAVDGVEGFALAKSEQIDLITLDISMDNESGIKMFRNLQTADETKDIPVVMVTGVSADLQKVIGRSKQFKEPQGFIEKPVDRELLLKTVQNLIG